MPDTQLVEAVSQRPDAKSGVNSPKGRTNQRKFEGLFNHPRIIRPKTVDSQIAHNQKC